MEKNSKCIVSFESKSKVYHKPGCHHVKMMKATNQVLMTKQEAEEAGFRICRCCNNMDYHRRVEQDTITHYEQNKGMEFKYIQGVLYVKTEVGCWKMVYTRGKKRIVLYHRNYTKKELDFNAPQYEIYHRQMDVPHSNTISNYLDYIYEHDRFKQAQRTGEVITNFSSKKNKKRAENSMKKRAQKRVDYLFRLLETQNAGYKKISFC